MPADTDIHSAYKQETLALAPLGSHKRTLLRDLNALASQPSAVFHDPQMVFPRNFQQASKHSIFSSSHLLSLSSFSAHSLVNCLSNHSTATGFSHRPPCVMPPAHKTHTTKRLALCMREYTSRPALKLDAALRVANDARVAATRYNT